jgi:hypothetical protein
MKKYCLLPVFLTAIFFLAGSTCYCQKNSSSPWDPMLEGNSEKWKLTTRQKMFGGASKVEFGPYSILSFEKLDSPVRKVKTKSGAEFGLDLGYDARMETDHEVNMDLTRKIITQKSQYYRMVLTDNADTTETLCSFLSITKDERQTVGGAVLKTFLHGHYNSEENPRTTIGSMVVINGFILSNIDSEPWNFSFTSGDMNNEANASSASNPFASSRYIAGYLKNSTDSLHINLVKSMSTFKFLGKTDTLYFEEGFDLINRKGEHLAAYQRIGKDKKSPYVWIQKDIDNSYQRAISSFLAIVMAR